MRRVLFLLFLSLFFWSCATTYNPKGIGGGFSEEKLENGNYEVSFQGNMHTSVQSVKKNLLRRCSEITIENGFDFFEIIEDKSDTEVTGHWNSISGSYATAAHSGCCEIRLFNEESDEISEYIYNAQKYLERNK